MARSKQRAAVPLACRWSPPEGAGQPLACIATTYTFHAALFEGDLLPRFLGLKFDSTEGERAFFVEREQALGTTSACVLVDEEHVDPAQATLRWDQLPVRVPGGGGVQHAKLTILAWQNCVRMLVASANLTRSGYRRNREVACYLDFFDDVSSAPGRIALEAVDFLAALAPWVMATGGAVERLSGNLDLVRELLNRWRRMPADFAPSESRRAHFVAGLPAQEGQTRRSPLEQVLALWGGRRACEVVVMTPFVGDKRFESNRVIDRLMQVPRSRDAVGRLVVPGRPSQQDKPGMVVDLPRHFRDGWASAWGVPPEDVNVHVAPLVRTGEKVQRNLHAKGLLLVSEKHSLLLCGSSNFSPHGMGVGAANVEANLCYLDRNDAPTDDLHLRDRLLEGWEDDEVLETIWPEEAQPPEDEVAPATARLPAVFRWAALDQRSGLLTLGLDPARRLPIEWAVRLPGERARELPALFCSRDMQDVPPSGRISIAMPDGIKGAAITCLAVSWRDERGEHTTLLPVQVERTEDLLPPEEFQGMSADAIIDCLLSGREPAEWIEQQERRKSTGSKVLDPLTWTDTSGYVLYRVRRLGRALAVMGGRLLHTVRTCDAIRYRLEQDPLGPCFLAQALARQWGSGSEQDAAAIRFALAEASLTVAHAGQRIEAERREGDPDLMPLFLEAIRRLEAWSGDPVCSDDQTNLGQYITAVGRQCRRLIGSPASGEDHAC